MSDTIIIFINFRIKFIILLLNNYYKEILSKYLICQALALFLKNLISKIRKNYLRLFVLS